jgi:hypothetical protein
VLVIVLAALAFPATALARLDPNDSITITAPVAGTGVGHPIYAGYPFRIGGEMTVDGNTEDGYTQYVVYTPSSWGILTPNCPVDYAEVVQEIDIRGGGQLAIYLHEDEGVSSLSTDAGTFPYTEYVNSDVTPDLTNPGDYVACAYLFDLLPTGGPLAVSPAPVAFSVGEPPGSATPPGGFGGPPSDPGHPSDLTLRVAPQDPPIRSPYHNLIDVSGRADPSGGAAFLTVTLKDTSSFNGCAGDDAEDTQITQADHGTLLAFDEQVTLNEAGLFSAPIALTYRRAVRGAGVICAYLGQPLFDVAVGFDRFTIPAQGTVKVRHHKKRKRKRR